MDRRGAQRASAASGGRDRPSDPDVDGTLAELIAPGGRPGASVLVFDRDLRVLTALGPLFDGHDGDPHGEFASALLPAALGEGLEAHLKAGLAGECRSLEQRVGDRTFWLEVEPLADSNGTIASGLAVALDVSDRTSAVAALRDS